MKAALREAARSGDTFESEFRLCLPRTDGEGRTHWVIGRGRRMRGTDGTPGRMLGVVVDITERRRAEERLQELQSELLHLSRLGAAGEMTSALAHELNQPLTAVASALRAAQRLLQATPGGGAKVPDLALEALERAIEQSLRAGQIVRRLRDFVAKGEPNARLEALPGLVEEASTLALLFGSE